MTVIHGIDATDAQRALLVDASGRPLVTVDTALPAGANLIGRVDARSGDKAASMLAPLIAQNSNLAAVAGANNLNGTAVPAGQWWHLTAARARDVNTNPATILFEVAYSGASNFRLRRVAAPGADISLEWDGHIVMRPGDFIRAVFTGCAAGDDLFLDYTGWIEST